MSSAKITGDVSPYLLQPRRTIDQALADIAKNRGNRTRAPGCTA